MSCKRSIADAATWRDVGALLLAVAGVAAFWWGLWLLGLGGL